MEVIQPVPSSEFNFDSTCSTPYAPSSPQRFGDFYFSAPSSPTASSAFYRDFNNFEFFDRSSSRDGGGLDSNSSMIPYDWEEIPGTPKFQKSQIDNENEEEESVDFEFGFSGESDKASLTADELFDGGKIKPLKPPPRLQLGSRFSKEYRTQRSSLSSPKSPRSPIAQGKKMIREAFSPKQRKQVDPFAVAIEQSRKGVEQQRGRERVYASSSRKGSRSLSPYRVPVFEQQQQQQYTKPNPSSSKPPPASVSRSGSGSGAGSSSRKWTFSFRDLILFRSASEGRASDRDPLRKFSLVSKKSEDVKNSSFRSTDNSGSMRRGRVSAHELHYKSNRAVAEEMKRKTVLPYKQGLFGWFRI